LAIALSTLGTYTNTPLTRAGSITASLTMITESPTSTSACSSLPPGPGIVMRSFAPNTFLQNAIVALASTVLSAGETAR
jgi:hypothetical protein